MAKRRFKTTILRTYMSRCIQTLLVEHRGPRINLIGESLLREARWQYPQAQELFVRERSSSKSCDQRSM